MKTASFTQKTLIVPEPSPALINLLNQLQKRKLEQIADLHKKKGLYFPKKK